jgi:hypothetical protein
MAGTFSERAANDACFHDATNRARGWCPALNLENSRWIAAAFLPLPLPVMSAALFHKENSVHV